MEESNRKKQTRCPVSATLDIIGGKYKAHILWQLTDKTLRFSRLKKLVPAATPKMLTQQLRELEGDGLLTRTVYAVVPPKVEYRLTPKGRALRPILDAMYHFGAKLLQENGLEPDCTMVHDRNCCDSCKKD